MLEIQDLQTIEDYIYKYGIAAEDYCGSRKYFAEWQENKQNLYKLLNNQLIMEIPFDYSKPEDLIVDELVENREVYTFVKRLRELANSHCEEILRIQHLASNRAPKDFLVDFLEEKKPFKISAGMRTSKALIKLAKYLDFSKEEIEKFRIAHSMVLNGAGARTVLCLSIHPMDFITMSDNANDWSSCMSWSHNGCYRMGTVEMMNSPIVLVAYLKSATRNLTWGSEYSWNSKTFRQLFYLTPDFLLGGKSYPYFDKGLSDKIFSIIREKAEENLGWVYAGDPYDYEWDYDNLEIITNIMYNDFLQSQNNYYPIVKSAAAQQKIFKKNVSGEAVTLDLGYSTARKNGIDIRDYDDTQDYYLDLFSYCDSLWSDNFRKKHTCDNCGGYHFKVTNVNGHKYCPDCVSRYLRIDPFTNKPFITFDLSHQVCIIMDEDIHHSRLVLEGGRYLIPLAMSEETFEYFLKENWIEKTEVYFKNSVFPTCVYEITQNCPYSYEIFLKENLKEE